MGREIRRDRLEESVVERISERLSAFTDLYLPHAMRSREEPVPPTEIKSLLIDLLSRDPALFLGDREIWNKLELPPGPKKVCARRKFSAYFDGALQF